MARTAKRRPASRKAPRAPLGGPGAPGATTRVDQPPNPTGGPPAGRPGRRAPEARGTRSGGQGAPGAGQPRAPGPRGTASHNAPHNDRPPGWPGHPYRTSAQGCTGPVCPRCGSFLGAIGRPKSESTEMEWALMPCTRCEEVKNMPIKMQPGGAFRWSRFIDDWKITQRGASIVEVTPAVAARCRYLGDMRTVKMKEGKKEVEVNVAMFLDDKTGEMFGQPVEKEG